MTSILMCSPKFFNVNYIINPWMKNNIDKVDNNVAFQQWNNLQTQINKHANIQLIDPVENLPDMVFTANGALCNIETKTAYIGEFANKERKGEKQHFVKWFQENKWNVVELTAVFEGAGECLKDAHNNYWYGYGFRGTKQAINVLQQYIPNFRALKLINPKFYHLDTCFCPLTGGEVIYYPEAFDEKSNQLITEIFQHNAIPVSQADAYKFACNALSIKNLIFVNDMTHNLENYLYYRNYEVIRTPLSEFMKSGGGAKCLTLQIE